MLARINLLMLAEINIRHIDANYSVVMPIGGICPYLSMHGHTRRVL